MPAAVANRERVIRLPALHHAQQRIKDEARRFNVLACGRRFGKSTLGVDLAIDPPAAEGFPVGWFSPTYKMLTEVWRDLRRATIDITARVDAQQHRIELLSGGVIEMWSLDTPDVARGRKYKRVVIDEAAMIRALGEAWNAVIRPTLADYEGDAFLLSTPKGRTFFHTAWTYGQDPGQPDWASWQMPTGANPHINPREIEALARSMPERLYQQEIEARFLDDAGGVFRGVRQAATATPQSKAVEGHQYAIGVDWGKHNDFTVLTVIDLTTKAIAALDRFNQIDYAVQLGRLKALAGRFGTITLIPESNSIGEPLIELLQRDGYYVMPFTTTNASKAVAIDALALAFEKGEIAILPDETLIAELEAFEAERLPSGMLRYRAPEGMHDDCVMSLALAWSAVATAPGWGVW